MTDNHDDLSFKQLKSLYGSMDAEYTKVAKQYEFQCKGCKDNCCKTLFYHHTYIEYLYLLKGFEKVNKSKQKQIINNCILVSKEHQKVATNKKTHKIMCPLNYDNLCILYEFRPMICRLHGIPSEFTHPTHKIIYSPGCASGTLLFKDKGYILFERTPYYQKLAELEKQFRQKKKLVKKIKKTVAQMLINRHEGLSIIHNSKK